MDHSAFDAYGFLVEAGEKRLFYTTEILDRLKDYARIPHVLYQRADSRLSNGTNCVDFALFCIFIRNGLSAMDIISC